MSMISRMIPTFSDNPDDWEHFGDQFGSSLWMNYKASYRIMTHVEKTKTAMLQKSKDLEESADEALVEANVNLYHIVNRALAEAAQALRVSKHQVGPEMTQPERANMEFHRLREVSFWTRTFGEVVYGR